MEIVLRAAAMFFFLWVLTRALGKRELSQMTAFELVLLVIFGDLVQQGVTQEDMSVTGAVLAVGTMAVLVLITSYISFRWKGTRRLLEGFPVVIIRDGKLMEEALRVERMPVDEVIESVRREGIGDLSQIRVGILESDGKFSFYTGDRNPSSSKDDSAAT